MDGESKEYEIVIAESAERAYLEILVYLYRHYSVERAEAIAKALLDEPQRLSKFPEQGASEPALSGHRYPSGILYLRDTDTQPLKLSTG